MNYEMGDVVLVPFPFVTSAGVQQKARPAVVVSDHSSARRFNDLILAAITSRVPERPLDTELILLEGTDEFASTGLKKSSVVRCEYMMTLPSHIIARKIGHLSDQSQEEVKKALRISLGL